MVLVELQLLLGVYSKPRFVCLLFVVIFGCWNSGRRLSVTDRARQPVGRCSHRVSHGAARCRHCTPDQWTSGPVVVWLRGGETESLVDHRASASEIARCTTVSILPGRTATVRPTSPDPRWRGRAVRGEAWRSGARPGNHFSAETLANQNFVKRSRLCPHPSICPGVMTNLMLYHFSSECRLSESMAQIVKIIPRLNKC